MQQRHLHFMGFRHMSEEICTLRGMMSLMLHYSYEGNNRNHSMMPSFVVYGGQSL